jgi:hypothetical protein
MSKPFKYIWKESKKVNPWAICHASVKGEEHGGEPAKKFERCVQSVKQQNEAEDPCWKGYEQIGTKEKNGNEVPNCVPINETHLNAEIRQVWEMFSKLGDEIAKLEKSYEAEYEKQPHPEMYYEQDEELEDNERIEETLTEEQFLAEGGKCTGPTQKTSSTSKNKKWMKCLKNPKGKGYKRVHWGQKGVKVTGKSGDTKRKKSFRSRHNCSTAKPGTPKYQACKDW